MDFGFATCSQIELSAPRRKLNLCSVYMRLHLGPISESFAVRSRTGVLASCSDITCTCASVALPRETPQNFGVDGMMSVIEQGRSKGTLLFLLLPSLWLLADHTSFSHRFESHESLEISESLSTHSSRSNRRRCCKLLLAALSSLGSGGAYFRASIVQAVLLQTFFCSAELSVNGVYFRPSPFAIFHSPTHLLLSNGLLLFCRHMKIKHQKRHPAVGAEGLCGKTRNYTTGRSQSRTLSWL